MIRFGDHVVARDGGCDHGDGLEDHIGVHLVLLSFHGIEFTLLLLQLEIKDDHKKQLGSQVSLITIDRCDYHDN